MAPKKFFRTGDNSNSQLGRGPLMDAMRVPFETVSLEQRHLTNVNHGSSTYVLQGYDCYFFNSRPITFAEPLPSARVCANCSVVHARAVQLPCGHTLCELCGHDAFVRGAAAALRDQDGSAVATHHDSVCPEDRIPFAEFEMNVLTFSVEELNHYVTFSVNARFGCAFQGELKQLKGHYFTDCCVRRLTCVNCEQDNILACDFQQHCMCCFLW